MRFRSSNKPPPLATRREQMRLLMLIGTLAMILFAVKFAGNPNFWRATGLFPDSGNAIAPSADGEAGEIDFGVRNDEDEHLPPDAFRARPAEVPAAEDVAGTEANSPDHTAENRESLDVSPELLAPIRDNTLGIRREESDAYFELLSRLKRASPQAIDEAARDDVVFRVVMVDSDAYRGKLLTIEGDLRRLLPMGKSPAHPELGELYEAWIFTPESEKNPWRVVALEIPPEMPTGESLDPPVPVRVTGYFFKREGYASHGGLHTAPLLLARQLQLIAAPSQPGPPSTGLAQSVLIAAVLLAAGLGFTVWRMTLGDVRFRQGHLKRIAEPRTRDVEELNNLEATDPGELLRRLAEEHREAEPQ